MNSRGSLQFLVWFAAAARRNWKYWFLCLTYYQCSWSSNFTQQADSDYYTKRINSDGKERVWGPSLLQIYPQSGLISKLFVQIMNYLSAKFWFCVCFFVFFYFILTRHAHLNGALVWFFYELGFICHLNLFSSGGSYFYFVLFLAPILVYRFCFIYSYVGVFYT